MAFGNEDAAAYTFIMVIVLIFVAALAYAYLIPSLNVFTKQVNKDIDSGHISEQTKVTYMWNLTFFQYCIGIGLIGFTIFCIVRAIEIAEAGGLG